MSDLASTTRFLHMTGGCILQESERERERVCVCVCANKHVFAPCERRSDVCTVMHTYATHTTLAYTLNHSTPLPWYARITHLTPPRTVRVAADPVRRVGGIINTKSVVKIDCAISDINPSRKF